MMMMGFAYQKGLLPVASESIEQAIELNGTAVPILLTVTVTFSMR